ncbi:MAG TPA: Stp1/IreP family PP2C-type Ser/Thr phosphatase [Actinomycetota bacterium]
MRVRAGVASDIGQVREANEDSYLAEEPLFAVADGMGGHRGGEVASRLALETVQRLFEARSGSLTDQVEEANRAVYERSLRDPSVAGMGTTLTAALVEGDRIQLAHVGDSRAYLFRDGRLRRLTEDHTLVHRMVQEGEITEDEAERHPHRSVITRALGVDPGVQVDEGSIQVAPGDRLLLCTDGLTGMVAEERIAAILAAVGDPQQAADRLVSEANGAGGVDNITVVILDVEGDGRRADPLEAPMTETLQDGASIRDADAGAVDRSSGPAPRRPPPVSPPRASAPRPPVALGRWAVRAGIAVAAIVLVLVGIRLYLDSQWFVGVSEDRVAIFRGVPVEVVGFDLHTVVVETPIDADEAQDLALYRDLDEGITADDRESAEAIVEQIRADVAQARVGGS